MPNSQKSIALFFTSAIAPIHNRHSNFKCDREVYREIYFNLSPPVLERLAQAGISTQPLTDLQNKNIAKGINFKEAVRDRITLRSAQEALAINSAEVYDLGKDYSKNLGLEKVPSILQVISLFLYISQFYRYNYL